MQVLHFPFNLCSLVPGRVWKILAHFFHWRHHGPSGRKYSVSHTTSYLGISHVLPRTPMFFPEGSEHSLPLWSYRSPGKVNLFLEDKAGVCETFSLPSASEFCLSEYRNHPRVLLKWRFWSEPQDMAGVLNLWVISLCMVPDHAHSETRLPSPSPGPRPHPEKERLVFSSPCPMPSTAVVRDC